MLEREPGENRLCKGKTKEAAGPHVLTYQEQFALAVAISSTVLQLHDTPWLRDRTLTCEYILVLDKCPRSGTASDAKDMSKQAIIETSVRVDSRAKNVPAGVAGSSSGKVARSDRTILWLGVLLAEIVLGRILFEPAQADPESVEFFITARKTLDDVKLRGGIKYAKAVEWCFENHYRPLKAGDMTCREEMQSKVVALLEDAYRGTQAQTSC